MPDGEVVIVPPVIVLNRFFFRTPRHHVIIKFTPLDSNKESNETSAESKHSEKRTKQRAAFLLRTSVAVLERALPQASLCYNAPALPSSVPIPGEMLTLIHWQFLYSTQPIFNLGSIYQHYNALQN